MFSGRSVGGRSVVRATYRPLVLTAGSRPFWKMHRKLCARLEWTCLRRVPSRFLFGWGPGPENRMNSSTWVRPRSLAVSVTSWWPQCRRPDSTKSARLTMSKSTPPPRSVPQTLLTQSGNGLFTTGTFDGRTTALGSCRPAGTSSSVFRAQMVRTRRCELRRAGTVGLHCGPRIFLGSLPPADHLGVLVDHHSDEPLTRTRTRLGLPPWHAPRWGGDHWDRSGQRLCSRRTCLSEIVAS